jgi:hypothetical protein
MLCRGYHPGRHAKVRRVRRIDGNGTCRPCRKDPVDATEPPRIVFEAPAQCRDREDAGQALRAALSSARAPASGWTLTLHVEASGPRLRATSDLSDAAGARIAQRELREATSECSGLARAMGVWAGLVLDAEVQKSRAATSEAVPSIAAAPAVDGAAGTSVETGWPPPAETEPLTPEHDWYLHHDDSRSLELGAGVFLMSGSGGGALAGPVLFGVIESGHGIFLRPSLAFGQTLTSIPPSNVRSATWGAGRMDGCLRLPGLYTQHHGMQLDLCAGADVGMTHVQSTTGTDLPYLAVGPSLDLRGELGGRLSAVLRGVVGFDVLGGSYVDNNGATEQVPLATARLELAFSWDVR